MRLKFYVIDLQSNLNKCKLKKDSKPEQKLIYKRCGEIRTNKFQILKYVNGLDLVYLLKELEDFHCFNQRVNNVLRHLNEYLLVFVMTEPKRSLIDHAWCYRAIKLTWERVEIENLMSWLSTLGGAFSSLGDCFEYCADKAGRISKYQLKLAYKCGDPAIVSRCRLYYSISLIQKGKLRAAKHIVLEQYQFAKGEKREGDERLYKMCHGIWLKLQYSYMMRREKRQNVLKKS